MKRFKKVAIIGVGLIGGSLALALKKRGLAEKIVGFCRHKDNTDWALRHNVIDEGAQTLDIVRGADCVVLAMPVETIISEAPRIAAVLEDECVVTDVGSTKGEIVMRLDGIFEHFIGSHPLAGSEKRGVQHASADLFENSLCILTPTRHTDKESREVIRSMWHSVGARIELMTPVRHDSVVSAISHLPHAAAFALMNSIPEPYFKSAAGGLKDTTRIAASDENLWCGIFLSNRTNLLSDIAAMRKKLLVIEQALRSGDERKLRSFIKSARTKRQSLDKQL